MNPAQRPSHVLIRPTGRDDRSFLLNMLVEAVNWDGGADVTAADVESDPSLAHYLTGWPRPSDIGVIAVTAAGEPIGAAWARHFDVADPGYGFVDPDTPEIGIAVARDHRSRGVGARLLSALIAEARGRGVQALSLSVADGNRSRALYEKAGFVRFGRNGSSDTMRLDV